MVVHGDRLEFETVPLAKNMDRLPARQGRERPSMAQRPRHRQVSARKVLKHPAIVDGRDGDRTYDDGSAFDPGILHERGAQPAFHAGDIDGVRQLQRVPRHGHRILE